MEPKAMIVGIWYRSDVRERMAQLDKENASDTVKDLVITDETLVIIKQQNGFVLCMDQQASIGCKDSLSLVHNDTSDRYEFVQDTAGGRKCEFSMMIEKDGSMHVYTRDFFGSSVARRVLVHDYDRRYQMLRSEVFSEYR